MKLHPLVATIIWLGLSASAHSQTLSFSPTFVPPSFQPFTISANISTISNLKSGNFTIEYNSRYLQLDSIGPGTFLSSKSGLTETFTPGVDPRTGFNTENITFNIASGPATGAGGLDDFQFETLFNFGTPPSTSISFASGNFFNTNGVRIIVALGKPIVVALPMTDIPEPGEGTFAFAALLGGLFTWKMLRRPAKLPHGIRS